MSEPSLPQFNIQIGNDLTWNVQPILHEIRHALRKLLETGESSIIDLRSIPLAPGEEETIIDTLGCGEVHAKLNALGPSEIYETRFAGVWLITHFNEESSIIGRFIEITRFPDILKSQHEDMTISLDQLEQELEHESLSDQPETDAETNT
jgi:hydrogenase-1 operon protein HyaF